MKHSIRRFLAFNLPLAVVCCATLPALAQETQQAQVKRLLASITEEAINPNKSASSEFCQRILSDLRSGRNIDFLEPITASNDLHAIASSAGLRACPALNLSEDEQGVSLSRAFRHDPSFDQYMLFKEPALDLTNQDWYVLFGHRVFKADPPNQGPATFDYAAVVDPDDCWVVQQNVRSFAFNTGRKFHDHASVPFLFQHQGTHLIGRIDVELADSSSARKTLRFDEQFGGNSLKTCVFEWKSSE